MLDFAKSGKKNVKEYLESQGLSENNRMTFAIFGKFLKNQFSFGENSIVLLSEYFKLHYPNQSNIAVKALISEIEAHYYVLHSLKNFQKRKVSLDEALTYLKRIACYIIIEKSENLVKYCKDVGFNDLNGIFNNF